MKSALRLPDLSQIQITDPFWKHYTDMVARVIVPYQWEILNDRVEGAVSSSSIRNFRIAAGEEQGSHTGVVFIDSDVYKWLETVAYCIHNGTGAAYEATADEMIDLIVRAQQADGYINTYYTLAEPGRRWSNLVEGHELYCAGYLIEAAIAYFEATGKRVLLDAAIRFADLICGEFGPGEEQRRGYPGHQEIELALVRLYRCTGESRYLDCARFFIEERGREPNYFTAEINRRGGYELFVEFHDYDLKYAQAHIPPRQQRTAEGHAVRALYMYCAMADIARETDDTELLDACRTLWRSVTQRRMYITGGVGSSSLLERFTTDYDLPNASAYNETCASVALALFSRRMAAVEHDGAYYGAVERALYNTVLAGISFSGDRYFYVNPLEVWPDNCLDATSMKHVKPQRQKWFTVACCPPNVARTLASLGQYIYALDADTVYVNLFISSSYHAALAGGDARVTMSSDLLHSGSVTLTATAPDGAGLRLAIRVPDYATTPVFTLDGAPKEPHIEKGYALFELPGGEHTIGMRMDVSPRWMAADIRVREDAGKAALMKGPCVYCLEQIDNGDNLASVFVDAGAAVRHADTELPGGLPAFACEGRRLTESRAGDGLYGNASFSTAPVRLTAVPYCIWGNRKPGEMTVWQKVMLDGR